MKSKLINVLLIVTSLLGYLEWGGGNHLFLYAGELDIARKLFTNPTAVIHPFTLAPLAGQILLLLTLFQKTPSKILTYIGIAGLGLLLGFMFLIGLLSLNFKIIVSTVPFIVVSILAIRYYRKIK